MHPNTAHHLIRIDRNAWWCSCGVDCLNTEGSFRQHQIDRGVFVKGEVYASPDGWRFRIKGNNNEIMCTGEAYVRRIDAENTLRQLFSGARFDVTVRDHHQNVVDHFRLPAPPPWPTVARPTSEQRAEMAAYVDKQEPGLLDDLGISREPNCTCKDSDTAWMDCPAHPQAHRTIEENQE
jgi:uncharacterized protein YegP (UPF0339 family)